METTGAPTAGSYKDFSKMQRSLDSATVDYICNECDRFFSQRRDSENKKCPGCGSHDFEEA